MAKPTIAIAGASGFIGSALCRALAGDYRIVGLTRRAPRSEEGIEWRRCDLYSLLDVERALEGCDYALYLVHSMLPSARLTQAAFEDLDLILADNFARAAGKCGVAQIVYLGGLVPGGSGDLSTHLGSRLEVERTLGAYGPRVTALRAGLVVGAGGSSLHILTALVRRLPAMLTPKWTRSATHPIALGDVVRAVQRVLGAPDEFEGSFDIGGKDVMSYAEMMRRTAEVLGVRRRMVDVPLFTPRLSTLWVSLVAGAPRALVGPLVESLRHDMVADDNALQRWLVRDALGFEESLRLALREERPAPRVVLRAHDRKRERAARTVRSVQRLPHPPGLSARAVAEEYLRWLPTVPVPGLRVETEGDTARFYLGPLRHPLLVLGLSSERSSERRALLYIEGGLLAHIGGERRGRFELRVTADDAHVLAAVHDFRPRLPWFIYQATQAIVHLWVMRAFGRHLAALDPPEAPRAGTSPMPVLRRS